MERARSCRGLGAALAALCAVGASLAPPLLPVRARADEAGLEASAAVEKAVGAILVDRDSGRVLFEKQSHRRWPPASMVKMMTVLIALEHVRDGTLSLDEPVRVSAWAARMGGSQVYLAEGEVFPLRELLKAIMVGSANDAAVAVAEHIAGSADAFVAMMNQRAADLGLHDTVYHSVHGLPPGPGQKPDLSSAYDLARLGRKLLEFPEAVRWASMPTARFRHGTFLMTNPNHLVRYFPGANGIKTGYYRVAGYSVTASATRGDLSLIAVVLGLRSRRECFAAAGRLLSWGFSEFRVIRGARRGAPVGEVRVSGGKRPRVAAIAQGNLRLLVRREEARGVTVEARIPRLVTAPVRRGQRLGEVVIRRGDEVLGKVAVRAERDVAARGWLGWLWNRRAGLGAHEPP